MLRDLAKLQRSAREMARWQKAQQQLMGGRHASALATYEELLKHHPGVPQLWFESGIAAAGELKFDCAAQAFARAAELDPGDSSMLVLIGQQFHRLRQLDEARAYFERAVAAAPDSTTAQFQLAAWFEREGRLDEAWALLATGLASHPKDAQLVYLRAFILQRKGQYSEAESALRDLLKTEPRDPNIRISGRHLLGVVLDKLGDYGEAMRSLLDAKALVRQFQNTTSLERDYDKMDHRRRELVAKLSSEAIRHWVDEGPAITGCPSIAFLGGHPRAGTTLIERILGAHPGIRAFDESEAFVLEIANQLSPPHAPRPLGLDELNSITREARESMGRRYLQSLLREDASASGAPILLDKNPSATASLHLWLRIFPNLKVIIPLRDPRDVILSCFFQNLTLTIANVNFLSLERTAGHYADLTDVWLRLRELGGFSWIETRYENLVTNVETEGRRVTEFLNCSWHPNQADYREAGRAKFVFAPTYADVRKPVHDRAIGRWRNYAEFLEPIQPRFAHYLEVFGYAS